MVDLHMQVFADRAKEAVTVGAHVYKFISAEVVMHLSSVLYLSP